MYEPRGGEEVSVSSFFGGNQRTWEEQALRGACLAYGATAMGRQGQRHHGGVRSGKDLQAIVKMLSSPSMKGSHRSFSGEETCYKLAF